jgi:hypothetical protein
MKTRNCFAILAIAALSLGCESLRPKPPYDPDAKETMVKIVDKRVAATDVIQTNPGTTTIVPIVGGGRTLFIPLLLGGSTLKLTVYEYVVAVPNRSQLSVYSDYPHFDKGHCVKLLESPRPSYPRLAPGWDCK